MPTPALADDRAERTDAVPVAAPARTSLDYQAELTAIKAAQARLTADSASDRVLEPRRRPALERDPARARGPLQPASGAQPDGTYPAPDANNPFADPQFPFANPPYAARAYSYVTVAQFEALKAAWHYKYLYNRPAPSRVDSGIQTLMPTTDLPAYPSEDAVLSGVTAEMLQLLFPARRGDHAQGRRAARGRAAVRQGDGQRHRRRPRFGQAVATVFAARAARTAWEPPAARPRSGRLADAAAARGEIPWKSLDIRPAHRCSRSSARSGPWMMTPPTSSRTAGPASLDLVRADGAGGGRGEELRRQPDPRAARDRAHVGGRREHAHASGPLELIAAAYISKARCSEVRAARAFAPINMALHDAAVGCWDTKYFYFNPRPSQLDPDSRPPSACRTFRPTPRGTRRSLGGGGGAVLRLPGGAAEFERQKDEAAIRGCTAASTTGRHRSRQGPRQTDRRLHGELRGPTAPMSRSGRRPRGRSKRRRPLHQPFFLKESCTCLLMSL